MEKNGDNTFAEYAPALRANGWAVVPATGKKPIPAGFPKWRGAPSERTVDAWAKKHPRADIVFIAGLTRTPTGRGLITVDADNAEACEFVQKTFGDTSARCKTRRGEHFHYDGAGVDLGALQSLRDRGLEIDIKHGVNGSAIVVAPPSRHEDDPSFRYQFADQTDDGGLKRMPKFNLKALNGVLEKYRAQVEPHHNSPGRVLPPNATRTAPPPCGRADLRNQSRGLGLNDHLCAHVSHCDTFDDLLDVAHTFNFGLADHGFEQLDESEVLQRTHGVWRDRENLRPFHRKRPQETNLVKLFSTFGPNGMDAFGLLMLFRGEHSARVKRGETFAINVKAMAKAKTLDWTPDRFRKARDLLLRYGFIQCVVDHRNGPEGRVSAQYILTERPIPNFEMSDCL